MGEDKSQCVVYDVSDDLSSFKGQPNHTLKHMVDRVKIYNQEQFTYRVHRVDLEY